MTCGDFCGTDDFIPNWAMSPECVMYLHMQHHPPPPHHRRGLRQGWRGKGRYVELHQDGRICSLMELNTAAYGEQAECA